MFLLTILVGLLYSHSQDYLSIYLVNSRVGYLGGGSGINSESKDRNLSKTIDGGLNWTNLITGAENSIHSLSFLNTDTGWAVGWNPILKTVDGGRTWKEAAGFTGEYYYAIHFANADTGWVVGDNLLRRSTDGGDTWKQQTLHNCCGNGYSLFALDFIDQFTGYAVGTSYIGIDWGYFQPPAGLILKTTDGGESWIPQDFSITQNLNAVRFENRDTGWAVGDSGLILYTSDGGEHWSAQVSGTSNALRAVATLSTGEVWVVGDSGTILVTNDGGAHWMPRPPKNSSTLRAIGLLPDRSGWIAGDSGQLLRIEKGALAFSRREEGIDTRTSHKNLSYEGGAVRYFLSRSERVRLGVYTMNGLFLGTLLDNVEAPGIHILDPSSIKISPGSYVVRFQSSSRIISELLPFP